MGIWDTRFDRECADDVAALVQADGVDARRTSWQRLLLRIAPHIEAWSRGSWLLARYRMDNDDDARAVLVLVFERLQRDGYANLRNFHHARRGAPDTAADPERAAVVWAARFDALAGEDGDGSPSSEETQTDAARTPFRAWLLTLVRYCAADHVRRRVGWSRARDGMPSSKRDLGTDAKRLADLPPSGVRPPVTDYVRLRRFIDEVEGYLESFDAPMRVALQGWLEGKTFAELAALDGVGSAERARKLVRAAKTRLRARFRS